MTFDPQAALAHCERVEALAAKATAGPWVQGPPHNADTVDTPNGRRISQGMCRDDDPDNFAFIAAARTGWPETAALLRAAVEEVQALRVQVAPCPLVHAACGACGKNIEADTGLCGCEDNRKHPVAALYRHKLEKKIAELEAKVRRLREDVVLATTLPKRWR